MERRRRRSIFDIINEIFDDILRDVDEEFRDLMRKAEEFGEFKEFKSYGKPFIYGFRISIGPDGKPKIEEFGNVRRGRLRPVISEEVEPLVDVIEENDTIKVVAEMPGVEKEKIKLKAVGRKLIIRGSNERKTYYKEVELPAEVDMGSAKATYRNGVLEITLKKKGKKEEYEIKVE